MDPDVVIDLATAPVEVMALVVGDLSSSRRVGWSDVPSTPAGGCSRRSTTRATRRRHHSAAVRGCSWCVTSSTAASLTWKVAGPHVSEGSGWRTLDGRLRVVGLDVRMSATSADFGSRSSRTHSSQNRSAGSLLGAPDQPVRPSSAAVQRHRSGAPAPGRPGLPAHASAGRQADDVAQHLPSICPATTFMRLSATSTHISPSATCALICSGFLSTGRVRRPSPWMGAGASCFADLTGGERVVGGAWSN
jgi:hypothetical protein